MQLRYLLASIAVFLCSSSVAMAEPARPAPPIPRQTGATVRVSSESELRAAVTALSSNTTIEIAPGTYMLRDALYVKGPLANVEIRGATNSSEDVVLLGAGMTNSSVPYGIWVGGDVRGILIANLTIRDVYFHSVVFNAGTQSPVLHNVRLTNAGQQIVKANPNSNGGGVDGGIVQYSIIEYAVTSRDTYTNGVDVHTGHNWIIRHNLFRNIRAPQGLAGPAILMWNGSSNTLAEGNTFIDCQREIAFGLVERTPDDHAGGIIRNNFIVRTFPFSADTAIGVFDSPSTQVVHNTILGAKTSYASLIEYRFPGTTGAVIANNLLDGIALARDGASGAATGNITNATWELFVNPDVGDLRLKSSATVVIDKVIPLASSPRDWAGISRPQGSAADVGGAEHVSAVLSAPRNLRISTN